MQKPLAVYRLPGKTRMESHFAQPASRPQIILPGVAAGRPPFRAKRRECCLQPARTMVLWPILVLWLCCGLPSQARGEGLNPQLQQLAAEFFSWRRAQQPATGDDIPRVERPAGWVPDFSPAKLAIDRAKYHQYLDRLAALDSRDFSRADQVDAMLLAAAIKRVGWELDVLRTPNRNPLFYLDQTLGSVFELLVLSSPINTERVDEISKRLQNFPATVADAKLNLTEAVQPFAVTAVESLLGIEDRLAAVQAGLLPLVSDEQQAELSTAVAAATAALVDYRDWLQRNLAGMSKEFSIGPRAYQWFLVNVALIPNTPDEIVAQGRQAWNQAVAWDTLERNRNRDLPQLPLFESAEAQIEASFRYEQEIRAFLHNQDLMTVPDWLMHYRNRPLPAYLQPLAFIGVTDDLTSETRLDEDAYSYIAEPSADLPYFSLASARDPRPLIAGRGGHPAGHRGIQYRTGRRLPGTHRSYGPGHRGRGSGLLCLRPGPGHWLPDRQDPD